MKTPSKEEAAALELIPLTLSDEEIKMVMRYRATALVWRADIVDYASSVAKMFPLERPPAPDAGIRLIMPAGTGEKS